MGGETIHVHFNRPEGREWYSDGDLVSGTITIYLEKDITVRNISAKLSCQETATVRWSEQHFNPQTGKTATRSRHDTRTFSHHGHRNIIFPYRELMKMNTGDGWSMRAGMHEFPFQFTVPYLNDIPPSWNSFDLEILWGVVVHIDKPGFFHQDKTRYFKILVFPRHHPSQQILWGSYKSTGKLKAHLPGFKRGLGRLFDSEHKTKIWAELELSYPDSGINPRDPSHFRINVETARPDLAIVKSAEVLVNAHIHLNIGFHSNWYMSSFSLGHLKGVGLEPEGPTDISHLMTHFNAWNNILIPAAFRGAFCTVTYTVEARVKLKEKLKQDSKFGHSERLAIDNSCLILSPSQLSNPGQANTSCSVTEELYAKQEGNYYKEEATIDKKEDYALSGKKGSSSDPPPAYHQ